MNTFDVKPFIKQKYDPQVSYAEVYLIEAHRSPVK